MHTKKKPFLLRFIDAVLDALYKLKTKLESTQTVIQGEIDIRLSNREPKQEQLSLVAQSASKQREKRDRQILKPWKTTGYAEAIKALSPGDSIELKKPRFASLGDLRRYGYSVSHRLFGIDNFTIKANVRKNIVVVERIR